MITGNILLNAVISGANNIARHRDEVNNMNIFPVPDGDTGTNMSLTMSSVAELTCNKNENCVGTFCKAIAESLLLNSRGNSGTILALLFKGFAQGLAGKTSATGNDLISALSQGVAQAYSAVAKPTEGTMLTVARVAYERGYTASLSDDSIVGVWREVCAGAKEALKTTPELLPVLKKAGVVDAGGKGICLIFDGMMSVFESGTIISSDAPSDASADTIFDRDFAVTTQKFDSSEITFTYCTEFIIQKHRETQPSVDLRGFLETIGDSVVLVDAGDIIKVHVHTDNPGVVLEEFLKFGQLLKVKIDNLHEQNSLMQEKISIGQLATHLEPADPVEDFGIVAVAAGEGIASLFVDLGCNQVVRGGQTMNPSVSDLLQAINATPAKTVFVLPNNKNIVLSAEQAGSLVDSRKVVVIPARTVPQGVAAMLAFNPDQDSSENHTNMANATKSVKSGQITFAERDSEFGGFKIKKGDILAFHEGKLVHKTKDPSKAAIKLLSSLITRETQSVTIIYGQEISTTQAEPVLKYAKQKAPSLAEVTLIAGDQPLDYFIISVE